VDPTREGGEVMIETILEVYFDYDFLKVDGFDEAIIGIDDSSMRLIYSCSKIIEILKEDMSEEDAIEHFEYNIKGGWVGEKTPIFCIDNFY